MTDSWNRCLALFAGLLMLVTTAMAKGKEDGNKAFQPTPAEVAGIAAMLTDRPVAFGRPIGDRAAWEPMAASEQGLGVIQEAEKQLKTPMQENPDDYFLEYTRIGNRTHWEGIERVRRERIKWLTEAECLENKGRFLPELEKTIRTLCAEKTWVWPAHDGGLVNFHKKGVTIDLFSSALAWNMGTCDALLGDKLSPEVRRMIRKEVQWRIFEPYKRMLGGQQDRYWLDNSNNWSAVCLAGVTGTALSLIDSKEERAFFTLAARDSIKVFLGGFTADGYCSEGIGYWNFGFGHYILLSGIIAKATQGKLDMLERKEAYAPATFGAQIEIRNGVYPSFADCSIDAKPDPFIMDYLNRRFGFGLSLPHPDPGTDISAGKGYLFEDMFYFFESPQAAPVKGELKPIRSNLRSWFEEAGILICRPATNSPTNLAVALKGGHNGEHHNHNDVGSYVVAIGKHAVLIDPGAEVYTKRTFSARRYDSNLLNSWGHPVPVVAGKLQSEGGQYRGKVLKTAFTDAQDTLVLDLKSPYPLAKNLKKLERNFAYSREGAGKLTVQDEVEYARPESFETALITFGTWKQTGPRTLRVEWGGDAAQVEINAGESAFELKADTINEEIKLKDAADLGKPTRIGIRLKDPVQHAVVTLTITPAQK